MPNGVLEKTSFIQTLDGDCPHITNGNEWREVQMTDDILGVIIMRLNGLTPMTATKKGLFDPLLIFRLMKVHMASVPCLGAFGSLPVHIERKTATMSLKVVHGLTLLDMQM